MIFKKKDDPKSLGQKILLQNCTSESRYAESFRTLRTNLFFSMMEKELNALVVTSSVEGEGKTTVSANLAHAIAQTDRRVLVVDMDLRRPQLTRLFNCQGRTGLTELLVNVLGKRPTQGTLSQLSVSDLLQLTRLQKRSCTLELENQETRISICFDQGNIQDVCWKNRPDSQRLAATLVRRKMLTEDEAQLALEHRKKSAQRLGAILYTMGLVSKKELAKVLSVHVMEGIRAMSSMASGGFRFLPLAPGQLAHAVENHLDLETLYREFNLPTDPGPYLREAVDPVIQDTIVPNLKILPAGAIPPNPSELVGSHRTCFLLDYLKTRFDVVILDTPPVMPASDALLAAPNADGTLLVIRADHTDREVIGKAVEKFRSASLPLVGSVLNRVDMGLGHYRHYQNYYGSHGRN
ncbi:MAG: DUF4388 domain-containing protein [Desulfobacterales bacterium]|nr:DUF4388 domain-containing protein [Desulfobacterales bacterium]